MDLAARWTSIQLACSALRQGLETLRRLLQEAQLSDDKVSRLRSALDSLDSAAAEIQLPPLGEFLVSVPLDEQALLEAEHKVPRVAEELRSRLLRRLTALAGSSSTGEDLFRACREQWNASGLAVFSPRPGQVVNLQSMQYLARCSLSPQQTRLGGHGPYFVREVVEPGVELVGYGVVAKAELLLTDDPTEVVGFIIPPSVAKQ
jgi:hypothetical protein